MINKESQNYNKSTVLIIETISIIVSYFTKIFKK
jgi:hypothetical protein